MQKLDYTSEPLGLTRYLNFAKLKLLDSDRVEPFELTSSLTYLAPDLELFSLI